MAETKDPFTLVYDALWELLEAHEGFTDLVRLRNRVKFSGADRSPIKETISPADVPEVRLVCVGGTPHIQRTSGSSSCTKVFEVQLASGDQRYDESLFPVEWEIYKALSKWQITLQGLLWRGKPFVKLVRPVGSSIGVSVLDMSRGIGGWTSVWAVEAEMWFTTAELQE